MRSMDDVNYSRVTNAVLRWIGLESIRNVSNGPLWGVAGEGEAKEEEEVEQGEQHITLRLFVLIGVNGLRSWYQETGSGRE